MIELRAVFLTYLFGLSAICNLTPKGLAAFVFTAVVAFGII
jgi:hypothetical protein